MVKTGTSKKWTGAICAVCALFATVFCLLATGMKFPHAKAENENAISTQIDRVETLEGVALTLYLTQTDYMTAEEWNTDSNEGYKWVDSLDYADRKNHNVHNALLDKNLSEYNYGEYIFVDGEPIKKDEITFHANRFTRVNTLGIDFADPAALANMQEITFKAGCQLPTLTYSYFGEGEFSCLTIEEDYSFKKHNGVWVRAYPFDGYEEGKLYDADEKAFYTREETSTYMGHKEAPMTYFTTTFEDNGWMAEKGYTLASVIAEKGDLIVLELVNPINAEEFAAIELNVFSNVPRSFVAHNAYDITTSSFGEDLQFFSLPGREAPSFTTITLLSAYYADENGMIDKFVFRILDDGSSNIMDNCFYVGAFACNRLNMVYGDSFLIEEQQDAYNLTYRFNAKGAFTGEESLDLSKVFINGESIEAINRRGQFATAKWTAIHGVYQIDVSLLKTYQGAAAIKNADNNFVGNNMQVAKGLALPNGEIIDRTYACRIYAGETFVDYEIMESYEDTRVEDVRVRLDYNPNAPENDPNIHFLITFDKKITSQTYVHAAQTEAWRVISLAPFVDYYDKEISDAFVAGGFKSSLFESVFINGKSLGDWQANDSIPTAVLAHYGQTSLFTLDLSIDCTADMFDDLYAAFNSGEDITLEVKAGMKFTTAIKTAQDFKCVVNGSTVTTDGEKPEMQVFYDGKKVEEGDVLHSASQASEHNIFVSGIESYSVQKSINGRTTTFVITYGEGESFGFAVQENIINEIPSEKEGCSSSLSLGSVAILLTLATITLSVRRKRYE
ncbi:MAG: hypothetical protein IJ308_04830 [Clostridia bacterium]|nr:hypothetical protein [Clostridia bacterium]